MRGKGIAVKIWLCLGFLVAGFVLSVLMAQYQARNIELRVSAAATGLFPAAQNVQRAESDFAAMHRSYKDAVLTENAGALEQAREEAAAAVGALRKAAGLPGLAPDRRQRLASLTRQVEETAAEAQSVYARLLQAKENMPEELQKRVQSLAARLEESRQVLAGQVQQSSAGLQEEMHRVERDSARQRLASVVVLALTLIVSIAIVRLTLRRSVIAPVWRVMRGIEQAALEAGTASEQVAQSGAEVANKAGEQAACLQETSASLTEILAMTRGNAEKARHADALMTSAGASVAKAGETMLQLNEAMEGISSVSRQISGVLKTIDEIAFNTNILALNAAVEAARAGSAGAGFSVVADEVRSLARRSAEAARDTARLIEDTLSKVTGGVQMVGRTGDVIGEITAGVQGGSAAMAEIAAASAEQRRGIEQITQAVSRMEAVTQANAASAQQSAAAAENMKHQVRRTRECVLELSGIVGANRDSSSPGPSPGWSSGPHPARGAVSGGRPGEFCRVIHVQGR